MLAPTLIALLPGVAGAQINRARPAPNPQPNPLINPYGYPNQPYPYSSGGSVTLTNPNLDRSRVGGQGYPLYQTSPYGARSNAGSVDFNNLFRSSATNYFYRSDAGSNGRYSPYDQSGRYSPYDSTGRYNPNRLGNPNARSTRPSGSLDDVINQLGSPTGSVANGPFPREQLGMIGNPGANYNRFTRSGEGYNYRYNNGLSGRDQYSIYYGWGATIFPGGNAFYPYYSPFYADGQTVVSPYGYYFGAFPPYIASGNVFIQPPAIEYVPYPVYAPEGRYNGYRRDDVDDFYLNRDPASAENRRKPEAQTPDYRIGEPAPKPEKQVEASEKTDKALANALSDIKKAWAERDIQLLAKHIRRDARVAVYLRGKYQYSLDTTDYLDMTRDAFRSTQTMKFTLDKPQRKERGVYAITGSHTYKLKNGEERTVHVSYALEKMDGDYIITQVGTAPDAIIEEPAKPVE